MIVPFKFYMHADSEDLVGQLETVFDVEEGEVPKETQSTIDKAIEENPFYEIGFDCTIDTETGHIEILGISK